MAANPQAAFDIGPLSWVKTEIEHSLTEARSHLDVLAQNPADPKAAKYVATHLHQVTGALSMVGLGAATRFNEEVEKLVATFDLTNIVPNLPTDGAHRIASVKRAMASLSAYLDNLMAGEADTPMMLAAAYMVVNQAHGGTDASESDLFSPDLSQSIPMPEDTVALPKADMMSEAIKQRRSLYQAGLLKLLRDKDLVGGARDMRNATFAIEALQVTSPTRSFWYTASGFFDAVASNPSEAGALTVQLFGKVDQQIKLLIDGVQKVPEKLFRDLLLVVGKSTAQSERIRRIRELYRLDQLLAIPDGTRDTVADDQLKAALRILRDHVQALKDHWLKFTSGNRPALEPFITQGEAMAKDAQLQPNRDLSQLLQVIAAVGPHLRKVGAPLSESQGLEVATALLLAETSLENYFRLTPEFATQVSGVLARVKGAMTGSALPALDPSASGLMDDITKRAQERLLMFQVGQEVQVNLATIESALDTYFRDPLKTGELSPLLPLFSQVQGALMILELDEAASLTQILRDRVSQFSSGAMKGEGEDAESVAEGISALGLYITALQQGTSNPRDVLLPALIRFGLAAKPVDVERSLIKSPVTAGDVDVAKQKVQGLYEDWKQQPEATASRQQLRDAVQELKQEAELIADTKSAKQSDTALRAIDATFDPNKTSITDALHEISPSKPAEAPLAQTVHLIDAPAAEVDQEILEIFLEEAGEVIATIEEHLAMVRKSAHDREALTTIRRGYHTLKGSGRMVGLNDLGEVAWNCEQVMNKWLKDDKPASLGLMYFIEMTMASFATWVHSLKASGTANIDGLEISRIADLLKNDKEPELPGASAVPASPAAAGEIPPTESISASAPEVPSHAATTVAAFEQTLPAPTFAAALPSVGMPVDLPSLDLSPPATVEIAVTDSVASTVQLSVDKSAASPEMAAEPDQNQPVMNESVAEEEAADIVIGSVSVPAQLFGIYLGEAETHLTTMDNEMGAIEANPMRPVSHEFMRAAHTLTSSSRTTGFNMIADVAHALEKWLQDAIETPPDWTDHRLSITRQSVDALATMVLGLFTHEWPMARADLAQGLVDLREHLKRSKRVGETTNLRAPTKTPSIEFAAVDLVPPLLSSPTLDEMASGSAVADTADSAGNLFTLPPELPPPLPVGLPIVAADDGMVLAEASSSTLRVEAPLEPAVPDEIAAEVPEVPEAIIEPEFIANTPEPVVEMPVAETPNATITFDEPAQLIEPATPISAGTAEPVTSAASIETTPTAQATATPYSSSPAFDPAALFGGAATLAGAAFIATRDTGTNSAPTTPVVSPPALFVPTDPALPAAFIAPFVPITPAMSSQIPMQTIPEAAFEAGKDRRAVVDDIDTDLLPIFLEEALEIVPQVGDALRRWRAVPTNHMPVSELARHLHTLKGSARMAGLMRLGELAHVLETKIISMDAEASPLPTKFDAVDDGLDRFNIALDNLGKGELAAPIEIPVAAELSDEMPAPMAKLAAARAEIVAEGEKLEGRERQALLRVNADMIDRFVNEAGELAIARSRIDLEMQAFKRALLELNDNVSRMKSQLREIEIQAETQIQSRIKESQEHGDNFDPLEFDRFSRMQELTRFLAESLNDVVTLQQSLQKNLDESDSALLQQSRLNRDLQQGLMGVRLVPLGNLQDRFHRLVRQTAKELDKKANLEFRGTRVEIDRSVLEKITAPFEHLLRNAVAHGLELPQQRAANGKSEIGEITIDAQQVGNEIMLTLSDDGGGLNFARIREKAIQQGMLDAHADVTDVQLTQYIFAAGFSTADEVTQIAGRGVGMDVVRSEIVSLGGRIDITSVAGRGTTFQIALPLTLAVTQAVLVKVGETMYAIPSVMIEQVQEYKGKRYEPLLEMRSIDWKGNTYPLRSMEALVGGKPTVSPIRKAYVILAKSGQQRAAVQVDDIIGNREIVVKNIGPQLARLVGVAGATVMGSGQVILIMNPVQLVFREAAAMAATLASGAASETAAVTASAADSEAITANRRFNDLPALPTGASLGGTTPENTITDAVSDSPVVTAPQGQSLAEEIAANTFDDSGKLRQVATLKRTIPLVMVVDDSLTVRKITSRMLTREGFEVATAKDGVDGLQQLQDIEPDIILLDIEMPRMDGFEFARNVRADAKAKHIPIIMITSRTADKHRNRAMELGVNEYMGKPYQEEQLMVLIRQYTKHVAA